MTLHLTGETDGVRSHTRIWVVVLVGMINTFVIISEIADSRDQTQQSPGSLEAPVSFTAGVKSGVINLIVGGIANALGAFMENAV